MSAQDLTTDPFQSIRPYRDNEVSEVLSRMVRDNELVDVITHYQFPRLPKFLRRLLRPAIRIALAAKVGEIESVTSFQKMVAGYMSKMISRTTSKLKSVPLVLAILGVLLMIFNKPSTADCYLLLLCTLSGELF